MGINNQNFDKVGKKAQIVFVANRFEPGIGDRLTFRSRTYHFTISDHVHQFLISNYYYTIYAV